MTDSRAIDAIRNMNIAEMKTMHTPSGTTRKPQPRNYWVGICVAALVASMAGNIAAFFVIKKIHVESTIAAVFPSHGNHLQMRERAKPQRLAKRIVLFGDSRIQQWKNFPSTENVEVIDQGIAGETTAQMRMRFEQDVLALNPDTVVLELGINDLVSIGVLPDRRVEITGQCAANMKYFVEALMARNIRTILLTIIPPARPPFWRLPVWNDKIQAEVENLNQYWISKSASPMLQVIDTQSVLQDTKGRWRAGVTADTLHITPRGYEYLNAVVTPLLRG